jgi:phenylacetic acid degradation protein
MVKVYAIDGIVPVVAPTSFVHPTATLIGDVVVGAGCYIGPGASLRGDIGRIVVGDGCNIQDTCVLHTFPGTEVIVEDWGHIGHGAVLHGCRVGRNALIGMNAVVMDGAVIGEECIVAALSFVKAATEFAPRSLVAGIPAKVVRQVTDEEIAWKEKGTIVYQDLARRCLTTMHETDALGEIEPGRPAKPLPPVDPLYKARKNRSG